METPQNSTTQIQTPPDPPKKVELTDLNRLQLEFLTHQACGATYVDEDGKTGRMSVEELATELGVTRFALYKAKELIDPDDWQRLMKEVRSRVWSQTRITRVWNGIFLRAAKGDYQQALLFLTNFSPDDVKIPNQKSELELGDNLAEFLLTAQKRAKENNLNVIDVGPANTDNA